MNRQRNTWLFAWACSALLIGCTDLETYPQADSGLSMMGGEGGALASGGAGGSGGLGGRGGSGATGGTAGASGGAGGLSGQGGGGSGATSGGVGGESGEGGEGGDSGAAGSVTEGCRDEDCPSGGSCVDGSCECPSGTHACGTECVSDTAPESCGESCDPCVEPTGGGAECEAAMCKPTCPAGERPCAGECIPDSMACTGQCPDGSHDCSGVCILNTSVNGCGTSSCAACSVPTFGTATCDGTSCDFECDGSHKKCDDECIANAACCEAADCGGGSNCVNHQCACPGGTKTCGSGSSLECVDGNCCAKSDCQASAVCSSSSMCDCGAGQTKCGTGLNVTCWPAGSCCGDSDCSNGFKCNAGMCQSFCDQQTRPGDVLASDYQCLDFDTAVGVPWPTDIVSGMLMTTTSRAHSLPRSLKSTFTAGSGSHATMSWQAVGATEIESLDISMRIHPETLAAVQPPYDGSMELLCIDSPGFSQCLSYTNKGTLEPISGPLITNYTGYFMHLELSGGAFFQYDCPLTATLTHNAWNTLVFEANPNGRILFNGVDAGDCAGAATGTESTVRIGLRESGDAAAFWGVYFDNVVVSVTRE